MADYTPRLRPGVFFTGHDGVACGAPTACSRSPGQYAVDLFIGSTLQMDAEGNSSTVTKGRLAGFGGAPNMGSDAESAATPAAAWLDMITNKSVPPHAERKLVVQTVETFHKGGEPSIVDTLDAVAVGKKARMPVAPVMIYGDDVTHLGATEEDRLPSTRPTVWRSAKAVIAAIAGVSTEIGLRADRNRNRRIRSRGLRGNSEDVGVRQRPTPAEPVGGAQY